LVVDPRDDDLRQSIRFCQAPDGVHLAVAEVGTGPPLVKAATWLTHVEHDWHSPVWRHWLVELGRRFRYIRYDARGGGLSDRDLTGSRLDELDTWTGDLGPPSTAATSRASCSSRCRKVSGRHWTSASATPTGSRI
jgi:hypothetical protein